MTAPAATRDTGAYVVNGERLVSVTEALNLAGLVSFEHVEADVLETARERGQRVAEMTAIMDRGYEFNLPEDDPTLPYLRSYVRFIGDTRFAAELIEHP